jgi:hypothetical protein
MGFENMNEKQNENILFVKNLVYLLNLSKPYISEFKEGNFDNGVVRHVFPLYNFDMIKYFEVAICFASDGGVRIKLADIYEDYYSTIEVDLENIKNGFWGRSFQLREILGKNMAKKETKQSRNISIADNLIHFLCLEKPCVNVTDFGGINYEFYFRYFNQVEYLKIVIHFTAEGSVFVKIIDSFNNYNKMLEIDSECLRKIRKKFFKRILKRIE